jgi:uncharacterized protein DUF6983
MSAQIIDTAQDPFFDQVVNLEGTDYKLSFHYNQREDCYYLSIATPDGSDIVVGIKIVADWPLLHKWSDPRLPPGELFCSSNTALQDPAPPLGSIGVGQLFTMIYLTSNQLP